MRRGQANALAVALGVSLIIVLLLSACYMLSSITVRTTKTLELLSEQARAVMYINGSGYLVGNTRPEYIVVKDPSGNIEVYLANSLGVELNKKFPQLSGIVYGVAGNGAVRQLKPAPWLNFTNANKYLSTVTVWPGWIYTYRAIAPINNTSWVNVTASNERELVAESGYLNATGSSKLRLVATVNYTVTSIFWEIWRILFNDTLWTRDLYTATVFATPGYTVFSVYSNRSITFNVYGCNTTSCTLLGSYSIQPFTWTNISVKTSYPYLAFNVSLNTPPYYLWPNWTIIRIYTPSATWFANTSLKPQYIVDAVIPSISGTALPSMACGDYSKTPVLNTEAYTEDTLLYYRITCSNRTFTWINASASNVFILGDYNYSAPKPLLVAGRKVVVNTTTYPVTASIALPPTSTIALTMNITIRPWIGAWGAYVYVSVYANGVKLFSTMGSTTPGNPYTRDFSLTIGGFLLNVSVRVAYGTSAIVSTIDANITILNGIGTIVLVPSENASIAGDLVNIGQYKAVAYRRASISATWYRGSRIIDVILAQN